MTNQPSNHMPTLAVIGSGSWATALIKILSEGPVKINWWVRSADTVEHIQQFAHNPKYLSDVQIDLTKVIPSNDIDWVCSNADILLLAMPAAFLDEALHKCRKDVFGDKPVFSAIKGMVPAYHQLVSDYLVDQRELKPYQVGVIAGPCHSEEVAMERQSYLTVSSMNEQAADSMAHLLSCRYIHTHTIKGDVQGIEYATVLKNIFSLAVGITRGMNYGDNFQAVLVSNAMQEMKRLLDVAVPNPERDINESAYLGDLLVTSYSQFSRNRVFGMMLGKGYTVKSAQLEMNMIAEGFYAAKSLWEMNRNLKVDLPVCDFVYRILYENSSPSREIRILEARLK